MITKKQTIKSKIKIDNSALYQDLKNAVENCFKMIEITKQRLDAKYIKRVKFELELIGEHAVTEFYDSYSPNSYVRQEGLFKAVKVIVDNIDYDWSIETGAQFMETDYDAGTDYVFSNSFLNGFHGGARNGPNHPQPGRPYWKLHGEWYKPAPRGPQPEKEIDFDACRKYIIEQQKAYVDEFEKIVEPYVNDVAEALNKLKAAKKSKVR